MFPGYRKPLIFYITCKTLWAWDCSIAQLSGNLYTLPVKFLLNSGRELLIELLQIRKAYDQRVPLWPNQFFGITQVFDLPIAVLEPGSGSGKHFTVIYQAAIEYFWIQERKRGKGLHMLRSMQENNGIPQSLANIFSNNISPSTSLARSVLRTPQHRCTGSAFHTAGLPHRISFMV